MSTNSLDMSPISCAGSGGRVRKITVNERVEQILQGSLTIEDENARCANRSPSREGLEARSHQISSLYGSSTEDAFVKTRVKAAQSVPKPSRTPATTATASHRARRVPPIAFAGASDATSRDDLQQHHQQQQQQQYAPKANNLVASPIKPVRCLSLHMLEQQRQEDEQRPKQHHNELVEHSPVHLKPWYKGYSSAHKVPTCSLDAKVRRYGAYGTAKMIASDTVAGAPPQFRLHESQSLDAIAFSNAPSPWSPPLRGSPTLWPEDSNYATGCKLDAHAMLRCPSPDFRFPTHSVGVVESDAHFERTKAAHAGEARVLEQALDDEKALRKKEIKHNREKLETWKNNLHFTPLSSKMDHPFVKVNARRAKQLTILHTPEYSPASKYGEQVEKLTAKRFPLRWRNMAILLDVMRRTPCRRPVLQDVKKLFALAYELASRNANPCELSRQQFWEILQKEYPDVELRHGNRLFSSYDFRMTDRLDIRVFFGTIRALRVQQGTPLEILCLSFQDFDATKRGVVASLVDFRDALSLCCGSEAEAERMEELAAALWKKMAGDLEAYQLQHPSLHHAHRDHHHRHHPHDERDFDDRRESFSNPSPSATEREAFESSSSESDGFSLAFVRRALQSEKQTLALYSEMLAQRREECFRAPIPPSR